MKFLLENVIDPLGWRSQSLVLMDSLHGDEPTLNRLESENLYTIVGANKLKAAAKVWEELPEWQQKRLLIGKRFKREGELLWNTVSVMSNLPATRLQHSFQNDPGYTQQIGKLYGSKMGMEDYFKDALMDLLGHRSPCRKLLHNRGYYALLSLAYNLSRGLDLIGGLKLRRDNRQKAKRHTQAPAKRMRIWTLRRRVLTLPARIIVHARRATIRHWGR